MCIFHLRSLATGLLLGALAAGQASAAISLPGGDVLQDGSFNQATYGAGGRMNITPLLYSSDLLEINSPAAVVLGTDLSYAYNAGFSFADSVFTLTYTITNDAFAVDAFDDLRFFVNVRAKGQAGFNDIVGSGLPAGTDPDSFQVFDGGVAPPVLDRITATPNLNGSTQGTCGRGPPVAPPSWRCNGTAHRSRPANRGRYSCSWSTILRWLRAADTSSPVRSGRAHRRCLWATRRWCPSRRLTSCFSLVSGCCHGCSCAGAGSRRNPGGSATRAPACRRLRAAPHSFRTLPSSR